MAGVGARVTKHFTVGHQGHCVGGVGEESRRGESNPGKPLYESGPIPLGDVGLDPRRVPQKLVPLTPAQLARLERELPVDPDLHARVHALAEQVVAGTLTLAEAERAARSL